MNIEEHIPLAPLTTFQIGGVGRYFVRVKNIDELKKAVIEAKEQHWSIFILGGGSNILIPDQGIEGLVIKIDVQGFGLDEGGNNPIAVAGAGELWDEFVLYTINKKLWGIENLSGIPGTVGGAVSGNIGAYGQALSQTLVWVEVFDTHELTTQKFTKEACAFDYRDSFFKHTDRYIVTRAAFELSTDSKPELGYKDLKERFADSSLDINAIREAVLMIRKGKFPDLSQEGTAGSFFKNPIVPAAAAHALKETYPDMPVFEMPETAGIKIPLAWLLDKVLNLRGMRVGGARLFEKQPLVIVADKNTSASDVKKLSEEVMQKVKDKFNIKIEPEVKIV